MTNLIQVFAKAPIIGQVKTRIAKDTSEDFALQVHQRLCERVINTALGSVADAVEVWTTAETAVDYFQSFGVDCLQQQGKSLGTRMDFALRHGLARHQRVIIIGADAASITEDYLADGFKALEQSEVVVGPAQDGGYVLIGATAPVSLLMRDMPWGTSQVMGLTLERLFEHGLAFHIMSDRWDIDTLQDLQQHLPDWLHTDA